MLRKDQLVTGAYYTTIANGSLSASQKKYIGRLDGKWWSYICPEQSSYSTSGDLCNSNFKEYAPSTYEEVEHFLACVEAGKFVKYEVKPSLYPIF